MKTKTFLALKRLSAPASVLTQKSVLNIFPFTVSASSLWFVLKDIQEMLIPNPSDMEVRGSLNTMQQIEMIIENFLVMTVIRDYITGLSK